MGILAAALGLDPFVFLTGGRSGRRVGVQWVYYCSCSGLKSSETKCNYNYVLPVEKNRLLIRQTGIISFQMISLVSIWAQRVGGSNPSAPTNRFYWENQLFIENARGRDAKRRGEHRAARSVASKICQELSNERKNVCARSSTG